MIRCCLNTCYLFRNLSIFYLFNHSSTKKGLLFLHQGKMLIALFIMPLVATMALPVEESNHDQAWNEWKLKHGKFYKTNKEENIRRFIWATNMERIIRNNVERQRSHKIALNHFSDLTHEEFKKSVLGCVRVTEARNPNATRFVKSSLMTSPKMVDWREEGYVTEVKNQGRCGSCYAFSTTGALEGQHFKKTGHLVSLSEQNIVDCSGMYGNGGCQGGLMDNAFRYIRDNGGVDTESYYPYYEKELGYCYFNKNYIGATDTGYVDIPMGDESALMQALATVGPISVAIDAGQPSFQSYKSGVFNDPGCKNGQYDLNHGVLVVGYGTENGQDYWLVKNSWSKYWGDEGYVKMARNMDNQCGIATRASYPTV